MKLSIQKFMMLFAAAILLLQIPISHANGLDARLRDDMQAKHYEPGGKYHLFGNGRGSVKNRVYSVHTFGTTAVGPVLPITHERTGFEGVIGYETHFSGHGHEVHSPFDNHDSRSTSDFSGGVDGGFTVYQLHRTGSEIHPADGYDGPQGGGYPAPKGARDIYSYYVKGTSTKTKINIVPQAPFSDRWLNENADATYDFFRRADEAGKLIWESDPNKNWWGNRMDDIRGIIQGAANPFLTGFQGLGSGTITDSAVSSVTEAAAQKTLQGINDLGNLSPEVQLSAATSLQDSAFAVKDGINSAKQWADAHPNITATAQTALAGAEAAGTVWGGKKVEINPTKWDWVKSIQNKEIDTFTSKQTGGSSYFSGLADADESYERIRKSTTDVDQIAANTGIKPANIQKVKDHVFYDTHVLDRYVDMGIEPEIKRFDSDLRQAEAWDRLENGTYTKKDIEWLKHEIAERWYEKKHNAGYSESHDAAEKKWTGDPWKK